MFTGDGTFYVLVLELNNIRLYEQTRHSIVEINIKDVIPHRLEDSVGYDYEKRNSSILQGSRQRSHDNLKG